MLKSRTKIAGSFEGPSSDLEDGDYWYSMPSLKWQELVKVKEIDGKKFVAFKRYISMTDDYVHVSNTPMSAIHDDAEFVRVEE